MINRENILNFIAGFCLAIILIAIYFKYTDNSNSKVDKNLLTQDASSKEVIISIEQLMPASDSLLDKYQGEVEENSIEQIKYTINPGDSLTSIWGNFGLSTAAAIKAAKALKLAEININSIIRSKDILNLELKNNQIIKLTKELGEGDKILLIYQPKSDDYYVEKYSPEILVSEVKISAEVEGSIAATAESIGIPYNIIDEFADIFSSKVEFTRDIHPGDSFSIIYDQRKLLNGKQLRPGKLRATELISQGKVYRAINIPNLDGKNNYYDQSGNAIGNFFLRYPVKFTRISSVFSNNRFHPVHKTRKAHNGTDFAAPTGTPVRAVADAKVIAATYHRANGNWVKLQHSSRYATAYLHLSKIAKGIKTGGKVARGAIIGYVGSTGYSTGPHLHYSFYDNGKYVDPLKVKLPVLDHNKISTSDPTFTKYINKLDTHA